MDVCVQHVWVKIQISAVSRGCLVHTSAVCCLHEANCGVGDGVQRRGGVAHDRAGDLAEDHQRLFFEDVMCSRTSSGYDGIGTASRLKRA